jgi:hypothetical protein
MSKSSTRQFNIKVTQQNLVGIVGVVKYNGREINYKLIN